MATRANKPISVTLGPLAEAVERRVRDGEYASVSEVVREGIRALDREEESYNRLSKARIAEALAEPGPFIDMAEFERRIFAKHEASLKRDA